MASVSGGRTYVRVRPDPVCGRPASVLRVNVPVSGVGSRSQLGLGLGGRPGAEGEADGRRRNPSTASAWVVDPVAGSADGVVTTAKSFARNGRSSTFDAAGETCAVSFHVGAWASTVRYGTSR